MRSSENLCLDGAQPGAEPSALRYQLIHVAARKARLGPAGCCHQSAIPARSLPMAPRIPRRHQDVLPRRTNSPSEGSFISHAPPDRWHARRPDQRAHPAAIRTIETKLTGRRTATGAPEDSR